MGRLREAVLFVLGIVSLSATLAASQQVFRIGQSYGLGGSVNNQSLEARRGIIAAFNECNANDCLRGIQLELVSYNDNYTAQGVYDFTGPQLIQVDDVLAILGSMGSTPTLALMNISEQLGVPNMPIFGPWSGATGLRSPFRRNVVNLRPGYLDEAAAIVNWLTSGDNYYTRVSALYQNDAFGQSSLDGLSAALAAQGLSVYSSGKYAANSVDIEAAFQSIFSVASATDSLSSPEVICLFSLSEASVAFMRRAMADPRYDPDTIWVALSIIGPEDFYLALKNDPVIQGNFKNVYATQAMPSPSDTSSKLVRRYKAAMDMIYPQMTYSYNSLEGYLDGRFLIYMMSLLGANINRDTLIDKVWETYFVVIDDQSLGPFIDASGASNCNQGAKRVYLSKLELDGTYSNVPEGLFTWSLSCQSSVSDLLAPIILGQSAALTGSSSLLGVPYTSGLKTAISRFNRLGGQEKRIVKLVSLDDGYDAATSAANTKQLLKIKAVGLIGWSGSAVAQAALAQSVPAKVPFFAPFSGAIAGLRAPCSKYAIHVRPSYYDETAAMIQYLWNIKGFRRISVFYQNDAFGISGLNGTTLALAQLGGEVVSIGHHERNANVTDEGVRNTTKGQPQAVVVFCIYFAAAQYIEKALVDPALQNAVFIAPSVVNTDAFITSMGYYGIDRLVNDRVWITQVFPNPRDPGFPVVQEYQQELLDQGSIEKPNYLGLEGYIAGRLVTQALHLISGTPTAASLTNIIYQYPIFDISGFRIGPFSLQTNSSVSTSLGASSDITECSCNQGGHQIYLTKLRWNETAGQVDILNDPSLDYIFETCGINFTQDKVDEASTALRGVVVALAALCTVVVVISQIGVIVFRDTKTMTNSSPLFLSLVLTGALLLSISPWFTMPWVRSTRFYTAEESAINSQFCMTWIWLIGIGFVLFFAPLVVKTWRVHRIFNNRVLSRIIIIKNRELGLLVAGLLGLEVILLIVWTLVSYQNFGKFRVPNTVDSVIYLCSGPYDTVFAGVQGGYFGLLALAGLVYAFLTRNIKYGSFKESQEIVLCVYLLTFVSVIIVPVAAALYTSASVSVVIRGIGTTFVTLSSVFILFGMKFYRIITRSEKMSTASTGKMGRSYGSTTSFGSTTGTGTFVSNSFSISSDGSSNTTTDSSSFELPAKKAVQAPRRHASNAPPQKEKPKKPAPQNGSQVSVDTEPSSEEQPKPEKGREKKKVAKTKPQKKQKATQKPPESELTEISSSESSSEPSNPEGSK